MQTADAQMGFCPRSSRVCSLSSVKTWEKMVSFAGTIWVMRHQNEMITSDNLANDLHWGGEHINWISYTDTHSFQSCPLICLILFHYASDLYRIWDVLPGRYAIFLAIVYAQVGCGAQTLKLSPQIFLYISTHKHMSLSLPFCVVRLYVSRSNMHTCTDMPKSAQC